MRIRVMSNIIIKIIKLYQFVGSKIFYYNILALPISSGCRFYPSCSEYAIESIRRYGLWKGSVKGLMRILRCNSVSKAVIN